MGEHLGDEGLGVDARLEAKGFIDTAQQRGAKGLGVSGRPGLKAVACRAAGRSAGGNDSGGLNGEVASAGFFESAYQ